MPYYDYECPACGCKFEVKLGIHGNSLVRCPKCRAEAKRLMSAVSFSFGWRLTDRCNEPFGPKDEIERNV